MKISVLYLFISILLLFTACNQNTLTNQENAFEKPKLELSTRQLNEMDISVIHLKKEPISPIINATGKVRLLPNSKALVSANIGGKVVNILVVEGENVKKGQALFTISSIELIELQQSYLIAKNQEEFLRQEFERQSELRKNNIGSLADYQKIQAEYRGAVNTIESLSEKLKLMGISLAELNKEKSNVINSFTVTSPIDGSVFKLGATLGQRVEASTELAEIINLSKFQADIDVFEKDIDEIFEGQEVEIRFMNQSISSVKGKVFHILKSIDPESRSIPVYVNFYPPKEGIILPEMAVKVKIKGSADAELKYTVPQSALIQEGEIFYVYAASKSSDSSYQFQKIKVMIGDADHTKAQINFTNPLDEHISIVEKNAHLIDGEMKKKGL